MTGQPPDGFVFELTAEPMAAPVARRALAAVNGVLPSCVRDDVLLLTTELVTNAVRHSSAGPDEPVRVELRRATGTVRVAVFDEGGGFTAEPPLERNEAAGLGLTMVDRLADRWAVTPVESGTCAWFEIAYAR
jgi:anti-sigma regulatory factor (Ser/Thr protein kinase)